ncbi:hypothetical protein HY643_02885 [Candidatus Woesearchaeota archaeon]|nr:hypothetical protein [Candidatus Woesearchaeota archaeon]
MSLTDLLKTSCLTPKKSGYCKSMRDFYEQYGASSSGLDNYVGEMAKILAGDYEEGGKKVWLWEDRMDKFCEMYSKAKKSRRCREELSKIRGILQANSYLNKKHKKKAAQLYKKLEPKKSATHFLRSYFWGRKCSTKKT